MTSQLPCATLHRDILHTISSYVDMAHRERAKSNEGSLTKTSWRQTSCLLLCCLMATYMLYGSIINISSRSKRDLCDPIFLECFRQLL